MGNSDKKRPYEPPRVTRLGGHGRTAGYCGSPGSGDGELCDAAGNTATECGADGSGASSACYSGSGDEVF